MSDAFDCDGRLDRDSLEWLDDATDRFRGAVRDLAVIHARGEIVTVDVMRAAARVVCDSRPDFLDDPA